jgi:hypothetical protein
MFADTDLPETAAMLACFAQLGGDELIRARAKRGLAGNRHPLPGWLGRLGETSAYGAVEMTHVLGDGDDVMLGLRLPAGRELALTIYIDHNMGTVVKDAFAVPGSVADLVRFSQGKITDPDVTFRDLDLADAGARIKDAVDAGARTFPPFESDTWPACRPLVEWAVRLMPAGGTGYEFRQWSKAECKAVAKRFLASPYGEGFDDTDHRQLLDTILWFGSEYGPCDPLRWSAVAVEILLADWIPRKIVADVPYLAKAPRLLRAFVRFCHDERHIRPALTAETLEAVDRFEPEYQRIIRSPRPQGPAALLAAVGVLDPDAELPAAMWAGGGYANFSTPEEFMLDQLSLAVGGDEVLANLDDQALPDEEFCWTGVPDDIRSVVTQVLGACDRCCQRLLDAEYRTACRRLLARVASGDPAVFRRQASADKSAAAICWLVGKANDLFSPYGGMLVKDLMAAFGLGQGSVSQRARAFLQAAGMDSDYYGDIRFGTPALLVSSQRRSMIESRDRYRSDLQAQ